MFQRAMAIAATAETCDMEGAACGRMPPVVVIDKFPFNGTVYTEQALAKLGTCAEVVASGLDATQFLQRIDEFRGVRAILATWGMPALDARLLEALPALQAVFYAAGEHRALYLDAAVKRQITFCSSIGVNSEYVALQTFASTILSLKQALQLRDRLRAGACWDLQLPAQGIYRKRIGLVAFGRIGRRYAQLLGTLPVDVFAWDPFVSDAELVAAGVQPLGLDEIFATCDVVSVHLPLSPATEGLIGAPLLEQMKPCSTLINTARGGVIDEGALVRLLARRPDVTAVLDVCVTEPPEPQEPLYKLDNCYLTPHISGAIGSEREHLGDCMVDEAVRWISGQPLLHRVAAEGVAAGSRS